MEVLPVTSGTGRRPIQSPMRQYTRFPPPASTDTQGGFQSTRLPAATYPTKSAVNSVERPARHRPKRRLARDDGASVDSSAAAIARAFYKVPRRAIEVPREIAPQTQDRRLSAEVGKPADRAKETTGRPTRRRSIRSGLEFARVGVLESRRFGWYHCEYECDACEENSLGD